jgi:tetratricopeptide (TPR) repeat protein
MERALVEFNKSASIADSVWALHGLANTYRALGNNELASACFAKICARRPGDAGLFKEALRAMTESGEYELALAVHGNYAGACSGLIDFYKAYALAYTGKLNEALKMVLDGLDIPDYREGDDTITDLYQYIIRKKAQLEGKEVEGEEIDVPYHLDFRMFYDKHEKHGK